MGHMYFVRHGQTVWNVENKICGSTDIDLTEKGHEQAVETGKKILSENIKADIFPNIKYYLLSSSAIELPPIPKNLSKKLHS